MKIFIDTNIFIRFLTGDDEVKSLDCRLLFELITSGKVYSYTSNIVLLEIVFVLTRQYKFPKNQVKEDVMKLMRMRNLTLVESVNTKEALKLFEITNIKLSDCFIAVQVPIGVPIVTYDSDFSKIKGLLVKTPKEIVSSS